MIPRKFTKNDYLVAAADAKKNMRKLPGFAALTWNGLLNSISHYQRKYGIKIYIAGETPYGRALIEAEREEILKEYTQQLQDLEAEDFRYAYFAVRYADQFKKLCSQNLSCAEMLKQFCEQEHLSSLDNLSPRLMLKLNAKLKPLATDTGTGTYQSLQQLVDNAYSDCRAEQDQELYDVALSLDEILVEMRIIQKALKPGEAVGYFDLNVSQCHTPDEPLLHSEGFIITSEAIIQTVNYSHLEAGEFVVDNGIYHTSANEFLTDVNFDQPFRHPQGDMQSCNMFALMYLKELLKNNAKQLKENSLLFIIEDMAVLIPPPQVLRYSQSRRYNDLMVAIVMSDEERFHVQCGAYRYEVFSLKGMLQDTDNKKLLAELPNFRARWIAGYKQMVSQRALMDLKYGNSVRNQYLLFKAECITRRVADDKPVLNSNKFK